MLLLKERKSSEQQVDLMDVLMDKQIKAAEVFLSF